MTCEGETEPLYGHYGHQEEEEQVYHMSDGEVTTTDEEATGCYMDELGQEQVAKPLMHPKQRPVVRVRGGQQRVGFLHQLLWPLIYLFILVAGLAAFVCLIMYTVDVYTQGLFTHRPPGGGRRQQALPCSNIKVEDVWVVGLPKILTESAMRLVDVNQDGIEDIIMGFATGVDKLRSSRLVCDIYFNGSYPCGGGMMALHGRTGRVLWTHWADHEIFSLNCGADLDQDGVNDCIGGGRAGVFEAASGRTGKLLWRYNGTSLNVIMNAYTGQYIGDIDGDGVQDILNIHGGDPLGEPGSATRLGGKLLVFSGRTGEVLVVGSVPDGRESYYSPVLYKRRDGTQYVLYGTGGETHSGSLWVLTLHDLIKGSINQSRALYTDHYKGIMTPPVLIDITRDGTEDIVFATFNSTVVAIDGETFMQLWKFSHPSSETYATPAPGYYNDDDIPDFLIRLQIGPGFPIYYHSITTVLDGGTGRPLLQPPLVDSVGAQTSPITLSMQGQGHDMFLYWISDCHGAEGSRDKFDFLKGTNVHEQSRADFCRLRFKTTGYSKMFALSQHLGPPGSTIYNSEERYHIERSEWVNASVLAEEFLNSHPDHRLAYTKWQQWIEENQQRWRLKDKAREEVKEEEEAHVGQTQLGAPSTQEQGETGQEGDALLRHQIETIVQDILHSDSEEEQEKHVWQSLYGSPGGGGGRWDTAPSSDQQGAPEYGYSNGGGGAPPAAGAGQAWGGAARSRHGGINHKAQMYNDLKRNAFTGDADSLSEGTNGATGAQPAPTGRHKAGNTDQVLHDRYMQSFGRRKSRHKKRHVGPHDEGGLQRLISTGTLVDPLEEELQGRSMDAVFATYWFYPAKTQVLLQEDNDCIDAMMAQEVNRLHPTSEFYGMDHDAYEHEVTERCLQKSGHIPEQGTYESQSTYNPYNVHMGQMTVYRLRLSCECSATTQASAEAGRAPPQCVQFLPYRGQQWPAYMGAKADSHWVPRPAPPTGIPC